MGLNPIYFPLPLEEAGLGGGGKVDDNLKNIGQTFPGFDILKFLKSFKFFY